MMSKSLIPGHVLEAQRHSTSHRVGSNHVEVREVGDDLQQGPYFNVLEVQGKLLTVVARTLGQLPRIHFLLTNFEHKLVVALIGRVLPKTRRE